MKCVVPLVAIHCITYNHEPYIRDCLEGFVMQKTNFKFVAIVHDDASTDGTATIIKEYAEKYPDIIKPILETENQYSKKDGSIQRIMSDAINATGAKYVAMCEGDDYWIDPYKLQKQVDFMEENEEYGMVATAFQQVRNTESEPFDRVVYKINDIILDDILRGLWIATMTVLFKTKILKDYTPPFAGLPMGDLPLWGYIAMHHKIGYLRNVTANYRRLDSSACHFANLKDQYIFNLQAMRVREYFAIAVSKEDIVQPIFAHNAKYMLEQCYKNQYFDFPIEYLWEILSRYSKHSINDKLKYIALKYPAMYRIVKLIIWLKMFCK